MKRNLLSLIVSLACCLPVFAQQKQGEVVPAIRRNLSVFSVLDTTRIIAYYALNADDVRNRDTYIDYAQLQMGQHYVKYSSRFVEEADSLYRIYLSTVPKGAGSVKKWTLKSGKNRSWWSEYQFDELYITDGQLTELAIMPYGLNSHYCRYSEAYPMQQWTLCNETQTILSYPCQKATCHWRGRDYEAWFTTQIPVRYGPWKFGGLPGLIMKISDARGEYTFECVRIEQAQRPITTAYNYAKWKEVKRENMLKLQKRINVNWYRAAGARRMDGTPTNMPDKPYSPLELE